MSEQSNNQTKQLGSILLVTGWILCIIIIALLYHKSLYCAKTPTISVNQSETKVIIPISFDSHYHLQGQINNKTIDFLIDTGASKLSISENLAKKMNLAFGQTIFVATANGNVSGYLTKLPNLIIAAIEFHNVPAIIIPSMSDEALLGMNILKKFDMSQHEDNLILLYKTKEHP